MTHLFRLSILLFVSLFWGMPKGHALNNSDSPTIRLSSDAQSLTTAYDCVNLSSGNYYIADTGLSIGGPVPLQYGLAYDSAERHIYTLAYGWHLQVPLRIGNLKRPEKKRFWVIGEEQEDSRIAYTSGSPGQDGIVFKVDPLLYSTGYSNYSPNGISGQSNLRNNLVIYSRYGKNYEWGGFEVRTGSGLRRIYGVYSYNKQQQWRLCQEIQPNGVHVSYGYADQHHKLSIIQTNNASGDVTFNSIAFEYDGGGYTAKGSNGRWIRYNIRPTKVKRKLPNGASQEGTIGYLTEIVPSDGPKSTFHLSVDKADGLWLQYTRREWPDGRYLNINRDAASGKVVSLSAPLGTDVTPITLATFTYGTDYTTVCDALSNATVYRFTQGRTTAIEKYRRRGLLDYSTRFLWGTTTPLEGNLLATATVDSQGLCHTSTVYTYDDRGNIVQEELYGNLSGNGSATFHLSPTFRPVAATECAVNRYRYSNDGRNLKLSEAQSNGLQIAYSYHPNSNLLISKLTSDGSRNLQREFYDYDKNGLLIETVTDDGCGSVKTDLTGVATRHISRITPRTTAPALGFPNTILESYLDIATGQEHLLRRKELTYDTFDQVIKEDMFDASLTFCYSLSYAYDAQHNLVSKTDPLGRTWVMTYDLNKNKTSEELIDSGLKTVYAYDYSNRLLKTEEIHDDGIIRTTTYRYDYLGNRTGVVDPYGNETQHVYDEYSREIEVTAPPTITTTGTLAETSIKKEYNILNQVTAITDPNGFTTHTTYNIRGEPTSVTHPDGTVEYREYNISGTLAKKWDVNGVCTHYTYDVLNRPLRVDTYNASGALEYSTSNEYRGSQLIRSIDALGYVTEYSYDGAGRKIGELKVTEDGSTHSALQYDALGRLTVTKRWFGTNEWDYVAHIEEFDFLDRVVKSRSEDYLGSIIRLETYVYDVLGNKTHVAAYDTPITFSTTETRYNTRGQPTVIIDALGNETHVTYDLNYRNSMGQAVLRKTVTDPLGQQTVSTHDTLGRLAEQAIYNPLGVLLASHCLWYDRVGNVLRRIEEVISDGLLVRHTATQWSYDACNRLTRLCEAVNTPDERITRRTYDDKGRLAAIYLPDGVELHHQYDSMGRLAVYRASDNTLHYGYHYDTAGSLVQVDDLLINTSTYRTYDGLRRITSETLGNGLSLSYSYDGFNRITSLGLFDASEVRYLYDAGYLREIQRMSSGGEVSYKHHYLSYDLLDQIQTMELPLSMGAVDQQFDELRRPISVISPYHQDRVPDSGYDKVGNLLSREVNDSMGSVAYAYRYDDLYQLSREDGGVAHSYQHDSLNNRLRKDTQTYSVNAVNALTQAGDTSYTYDARGNPTQSRYRDQITSYRYDALGRLTQVETATSLQCYQYDSFNRRISTCSSIKGADGGWIEQSTRRSLYADQNEIGAVDRDNRIVELRVLGKGRGAEIAAAVALELDGVVYIPLHDLCGNVVSLVDVLANRVIECYRYTAFGEEEIYDAGRQLVSDTAIGNPWRFSSKRVDEQTGLVFFGRRYYNPITGRWLTPDPLGLTAGPNLYSYVRNSPLTHLDLYGLYEQRQAPDFTYTRPSYSSLARKGATFPGRCIEGFGHHFLPPGPLKQGVKAIGRVASLRPAGGCPYCRDYDHYYYQVPGVELPNVRLSCCNGQGNRWYDAERFGEYISSSHGGYKVHGIANTTGGLLYDTADTVAMKTGANSRLVWMQAAQWISLYNDMEGHNNRVIEHRAFSKGAEVAWQASRRVPKDVRNCVKIDTLGPARLIPDGRFRAATNTVSTRDPIPLLADPLGCIRGCNGTHSNVQFVEGSGWFDHPWSNPTYSAQIQEIGWNFQRQYLGER